MARRKRLKLVAVQPIETNQESPPLISASSSSSTGSTEAEEKERIAHPQHATRVRLDRVGKVSSSTVKVALAWLGALLVIWLNTLEDKQASVGELRGGIQALALNEADYEASEDSPQNETIARNQKGNIGRLRKASEQIELFGLKLRLPATIVPPAWSALLIALIVYMHGRRLLIWTLFAGAQSRLKLLPAMIGKVLKESEFEAPLWIAPAPSRVRQQGRVETRELCELVGWYNQGWIEFAIFLTACALVALQLRVVLIGLRIAEWTSLGVQSRQLSLLSAFEIWLLCATFFVVWRWFRPTVVPDQEKSESNPNGVRRWETTFLVSLFILLELLSVFPVASRLRILAMHWMPTALTVGMGCLGAVLISEFILLGGRKEGSLVETGGRRQFLRLIIGIAGGISALGAQWILTRKPRYRRKHARGPTHGSSSLPAGFYGNFRLPHKRTKYRARGLPGKEKDKITKPALAVCRYVDKTGSIRFGGSVAIRHLKPFDVSNISMVPPPGWKQPMPHVFLSRATPSFETAALECLEKKDYDQACKFLILGIKHDLFFKRRISEARSTRLFDLLAMVIFRHNQDIHLSAFESLVKEADELSVPISHNGLANPKKHVNKARNHRFKHQRKSSGKPERKTVASLPHNRTVRIANRLATWEQRKKKWQNKAWQSKIKNTKNVKWVALPM